MLAKEGLIQEDREEEDKVSLHHIEIAGTVEAGACQIDTVIEIEEAAVEIEEWDMMTDGEEGEVHPTADPIQDHLQNQGDIIEGEIEVATITG